MQRLIIPGELPDLNTIINISKKHWAEYHSAKRKYTQAVAMIAKAHLRPVKSYPVCVEITWFCKNKRRDPDNIAHAKKYILDGLVLAGILKSDSFKNISGFVDTFGVDIDNPRVEVCILENVAQM